MTSSSSDEIPKLPLVMAMGVIFGVMPMLPHGGPLARVIDVIYKRIGAVGLIGLPAITLTMEKTAYDTYCAFYGHSIYAAAKEDPTPKHGGFPSGGASLPSFALIEPRHHADAPLVFRWRVLGAPQQQQQNNTTL
mmetsp:Transcript_16390/g.53366  ORF Transcript_16390/g.53366 Transcript_16390/m.53366 type:complete len:135 (+) Transcript_16390:28-432(+)